MSFYHKSLKYKAKYLMLVGGGTLKDLDPDTNTHASSFLGCKEVVQSLTSKNAANNIEWKAKIKTNEYSQTNPDNMVCNDVRHENKEACNQYVNNCKKHHLYNKYNCDNLDVALFHTINYDNLDDARMCILLGANCNYQHGTFSVLSQLYFSDKNPEFEQLLIDNGATPLTHIEANAYNDANDFYGHNRINMFNMPNTIVTIGESAFRSNHITDLHMSESLRRIENDAFYNNKIEQLNIVASLESIDAAVFARNKINNLVFNPGSLLTIIGASAFSNNKISELNLPNSLTIIGASAFSNNKIVNLVIPNSVTTIGERAFTYNNLGTVIIPESVISIGENAFMGNGTIQTVEIPERFRNEMNSICGDTFADRTTVTNVIYT